MVVVIGAGPVGIYTAGLLLQYGFKVKLVESGGFENESSFLNRNSYIFKSPSAMPTKIHRVGGGTNYWHARFGEFLKEDFADLPSIKVLGWPFAKDALINHYKDVCKEISSNNLSDEAYILSNLSDLYKNLDSGLDLRLFRFAKSYSFSKKLKQMQDDPNLTLITNCRVDSISRLKGEMGLNYVCHVTTDFGLNEIQAQTVIICAGTLQSTKLILNSPNLNGAPFNKVAGRGLMEHLEGHIGELKVPASHIAIAAKFRLSHDNRLEGLDAGVGIRLNSQTQLSLDLPSVHLELRPRPRIFHFPSKLGNGRIPNPLFLFERIYKLIRHHLLESLDTFYGFQTYGLWVKAEELRSYNSKLEIEENNADSRLIYSHKVSELTYEKFFESLQLLLPRIASMFNAKLRLYDWVLEQRRNPKIETNWHPMGTLPIGDNAETSICGPDLQVHSNDGLYILSPAVFNRGSNGNPTFTTLALASKLVKENFYGTQSFG